MIIKIKRMGNSDPSFPTPCTGSRFSSGFDLHADLKGEQNVFLKPNERKLVMSGYAWEIPAGWEGQVRPRSGLALKHGITCANSPGTIDSDYRGEVGIIVINLSKKTFTIRHGQRLAQMIIAPVSTPDIKLDVVAELEDSKRGEGGFGSTGD